MLFNINCFTSLRQFGYLSLFYRSICDSLFFATKFRYFQLYLLPEFRLIIGIIHKTYPSFEVILEDINKYRQNVDHKNNKANFYQLGKTRIIYYV